MIAVFILSVLAWAQLYTSLGWSVVPVGFRSKRPAHNGRYLKNWQELRLKPVELSRYFNDEPQNIGVLLGDPSDGLVDVDLDCVEAIELAPAFLPDTATFGRASAQLSHRLFYAPGAITERFLDITGETMFEMRSTGAQTVIPPSVHKDTGEAIAWSPLAPRAVRLVVTLDATELRDRVQRLAVASLLMRHGWPYADAVARAQGDIANGVGMLGTHVRRWLGVADPVPPAPDLSRPGGGGWDTLAWRALRRCRFALGTRSPPPRVSARRHGAVSGLRSRRVLRQVARAQRVVVLLGGTRGHRRRPAWPRSLVRRCPRHRSCRTRLPPRRSSDPGRLPREESSWLRLFRTIARRWPGTSRLDRRTECPMRRRCGVTSWPTWTST